MAEIDDLLGVNPLQKVTTGEAVKMMVMNALGFVSKPLYMFPEYIDNKALPLYFRADLMPDDFNDDTIGRALDRLYENDPTAIFMRLALKVASDARLRLNSRLCGHHVGHSQCIEDVPSLFREL